VKLHFKLVQSEFGLIIQSLFLVRLKEYLIKANVPGIGLGRLELGGSGEIDGTDAVHSSNEKS